VRAAIVAVEVQAHLNVELICIYAAGNLRNLGHGEA